MRVRTLFLRKVMEIYVTRRLDFSSKRTKNAFGGPLGELTALPHTPSWIEGVLLLRGGEGRRRERRAAKGREGAMRPNLCPDLGG